LDAVQGYNAGQLLEIVLKRCGDNLSRSNIMHEAENLKDVHLDMLLPGITVDTTPSDHHPIRQMQLMEFKGDGWVAKGEVISGE
jgi:branched-chain amino acid transport system substrate-binding protein